MQYSPILDTSGAVRIAQMLQNMSSVWSPNRMVNAPSGNSFWSIPYVPGAINWIALWVSTRVFDPFFSVSIWIWAGWVLSGLVVYWIACEVGVHFYGAILSGVLFEILPWMREKVMTHIAYVYVCVPLVVILILLKFSKNPSVKLLKLLGLAIALTFFFDLYWFFFNLYLVFCGAVLYRKQLFVVWSALSKRTQVWVKSGTIGSVFLYVFGYYSIWTRMRGTSSEYRPLQVATLDFIDQFNGSILRYIDFFVFHNFTNRNVLSRGTIEDIVNYCGIGVAIFAFFAVILKPKEQDVNRSILRQVGFFAATCFVLTLPTTIDFFQIRIWTPVAAIRFLMPGVRVFSRAGMITEALLCVLCVAGISVLLNQFRQVLVKRILIMVVVALLILDVNPTGRRFVNDDYNSFSQIHEVLNNARNVVLLELNPVLNKLYFAPNLSNAPVLNNPLDSRWNESIALQASLGDKNFSSYLQFKKVTHLLVPADPNGEPRWSDKWGSMASINLDFAEPFFSVTAHASGQVPAVLLQVNNIQESEYCENCVPYSLSWSGVRPNFFSPVRSLAGSYYEDGLDVSWVLEGESPQLKLRSSGSSGTSFRLAVDLNAAFGAEARPQVVNIKTSMLSKTTVLRRGAVTRVEIFVKPGEDIYFSSFLPCVQPNEIQVGNPDTRKLCWGISNIEVTQ
jgi:hypothetical protein